VDDDAKQLPFGEAEPGVTAIELLLPLTLKWANESGHTVSQAINKLTVQPAGVLGRNAGQLAVGAQADILIFDPQIYWQVNHQHLFSQGANTPYLGIEIQGQVSAVLVDGRIVFDRAQGGFNPELSPRS
jgi:dihydroorotase